MPVNPIHCPTSRTALPMTLASSNLRSRKCSVSAKLMDESVVMKTSVDE